MSSLSSLLVLAAADTPGRPRHLALSIVLTLVLLLLLGVWIYWSRYSVFPAHLRREPDPVMPREANSRLFNSIGVALICSILLLTTIWWRWIV